MPDRLAVPADDDVPLVEARRGTRALRVDTHHHGARFVAAFDGNRLEAEAEIAARDAPVALKLRRDAFDRGRWDDEHTTTRPENRHADRLASRVEREAAFGAPPQTQIKLDPGLDLPATQGSPGSGGAGHDANRDGGRTVLGAHRHSERACGDGQCLEQNW